MRFYLQLQVCRTRHGAVVEQRSTVGLLRSEHKVSPRMWLVNIPAGLVYRDRRAKICKYNHQCHISKFNVVPILRRRQRGEIKLSVLLLTRFYTHLWELRPRQTGVQVGLRNVRDVYLDRAFGLQVRCIWTHRSAALEALAGA